VFDNGTIAGGGLTVKREVRLCLSRAKSSDWPFSVCTTLVNSMHKQLSNKMVVVVAVVVVAVVRQ
jgi:hypothetical protein